MIKDPNQNKKPLIYYMAVAIIVIMLLNAFVFPMLLQRQVQEVGYSDFLKMVDAGKVSEVSMDENGEQLVFIAKGDVGQEAVCKTAGFPACASGWRMPVFRFPRRSRHRTVR